MLLSTGSVVITPTRAIPLFGFAERNSVFSHVKDNLEINLAVLKQDDRLVLLFSIDTLFAPEEFVKIITDAFGKQYGFEESDVWVNATHTHFAPALDKEKPGLGKLDDKYYQEVSDKLISLTGQVLQNTGTETKLSYGHNQSVLNVNRRKKLLRPGKGFGLYRKVLMYPDYSGVKDDNIHLLLFSNSDNKPQMILWNYACHPVGHVHRHQVTAEYIGRIRQELRKHYNNPKLVVIFQVGFAGNIKPDITAVTNSRGFDKLKYFFQLGPKYTRFPTTDEYSAWCNMLWEEVKIAAMNSLEITDAKIENSHYSIPLAEVIGDDFNHKLHFKKLVLGSRLQLIGISAEVLAEYSQIIDDMFPGQTIIKSGCLAGTRLYLPSDKNISEGGYEAHGFKHRFNIKGRFTKNINNQIIDAISKL